MADTEPPVRTADSTLWRQLGKVQRPTARAVKADEAGPKLTQAQSDKLGVKEGFVGQLDKAFRATKVPPIEVGQMDEPEEKTERK